MFHQHQQQDHFQVEAESSLQCGPVKEKGKRMKRLSTDQDCINYHPSLHHLIMINTLFRLGNRLQ